MASSTSTAAAPSKIVKMANAGTSLEEKGEKAEEVSSHKSSMRPGGEAKITSMPTSSVSKGKTSGVGGKVSAVSGGFGENKKAGGNETGSV